MGLLSPVVLIVVWRRKKRGDRASFAARLVEAREPNPDVSSPAGLTTASIAARPVCTLRSNIFCMRRIVFAKIRVEILDTMGP